LGSFVAAERPGPRIAVRPACWLAAPTPRFNTQRADLTQTAYLRMQGGRIAACSGRG
jgi:hypothetical protein